MRLDAKQSVYRYRRGYHQYRDIEPSHPLDGRKVLDKTKHGGVRSDCASRATMRALDENTLRLDLDPEN